jgi:hypothetical protein
MARAQASLEPETGLRLPAPFGTSEAEGDPVTYVLADYVDEDYVE